MFNTRPKIEFFSLSPHIANLAPILPAHHFKPKWFDAATDEFVDMAKKDDFGTSIVRHTAKCPGVFNLIRYGWVMTTWQDIVIETNGDKQTFKWSTPNDQKKLKSKIDLDENIGFNSREQLSDYMGGWDDSLGCVLKIQTPWRIIVPKDYYLLEGPLPYSVEKRFTTLPGFFSQEYGVAQLNVQLKWHVLNGKTLIKAGTPISHYMLVPKIQADMTSMEANEKQLHAEEITQLEINRRFVSDRAKSKCVFGKLFK
jgi:hypothetical protein